MRTRWGQRTTAAWAVVLVAAIAVVVLLARVTVFKSTSPPKPSSEQTLRLDPGTGQTRSRAAAGGGQTASAVDGGDYSTCALVQGDTVECWGDDAHGQLGDGTQLNTLIPVKVSLGRRALAVAAGGSHACAVLADGTVRCWGANTHGELGDGNETDSATPVPVPGLRGVLQVVAGVAHTCALTRSHRVFCWGANGNGQVGDGSTVDRMRPVAVAGFRGTPVELTAGLAHTCALIADGTAACWGSNANGELGNGTLVDSPVPADVVGTTGPVKWVDAGDAHTCALLVDGSVECWGWNIEGQLGNGGGSDSATPVAVTGLRSAVSAIAAGGSHTCVLTTRGGVSCWGANLYGQLGNGTTSDTGTPTPVAGLQNGVVAVTAGLYHSCAILDGGSATCWGWNAQGQLGNGTMTSASAPVGVATLGLASDGTGTMVAAPPALRSDARNATVSLTYVTAPGGIHNGAVAVTVPPGWSLPSTKPGDPGYSTATAGRVITVGRTISVAGLTLGSGRVLHITYGDRARGGPGAKPAPPGGAAWRTREQSSSSGNLSLLKRSPVVRVLSPDGTGTLETKATAVANGAQGIGLAFTYTAGTGGLADGVLTVVVPPGWSPPSTTPSQPGAATASAGTVTAVRRTIRVSGLTLPGGATVKIVYGSRRGGGPGARAPRTNVGSQPWVARTRSSPDGTPRQLGASPQVNVLSANGSGHVFGFQSTVANGATGVHLTFNYQADAGGIDNGAITLKVPQGWSPPSASANDPGYVSGSVPGIRVSGRTIAVPLKELGSGNTVQVTYGSGKGANAPTSNVGPQQWVVTERSTAHSKLRPIAQLPTVTVLSADGSGRLSRATGPVAAGSTGNTIVFVYQADAGGLQDGTVTLTVPDGWSNPSTNGGDAGYVTATGGSISVSGRTITLSHVLLSGGSTLSIIYGSRTGGGPGATAPHGSLGPTLWPAAEQSTATGTLKPLRR